MGIVAEGHPRDLSPQARLRTAIPGPNSQRLATRQEGAVPRGLSSVLPVFIDRAGRGPDTGILTDVDGNRLIDFGSGIAVTSIGGAHEKVRAAIADQAEAGSHFCFPVTPYDSYIALAGQLNDLVPGENNRTVLFNSGAEAVENAVKIARKATGRQAVVVSETAFHGRTNLTMSMTARQSPYKVGGSYAPEVYRVPMSYPLRDGMNGNEAAAHTDAHINRYIGWENVAAVVFEPIAGEGGFVVPAAGFTRRLADMSERAGAVFVADEIQTGFGRTGEWFAVNHEDVTPHLMTTGKALGGGLPISAVTGRRATMDSVDPGGLGGTFGGNPVAAEAALATLAVIQDENVLERVGEIEATVMPTLQDAADGNPHIAEVRGRGAMIAFEAVNSQTGDPNPAFAKNVAAAAHEQGVVLLTAGVDGNVVRLLPPLTIEEDVLQAGLSAVKNAIRTASHV